MELGIDVNTADMIYQPTMDIDSMSNVGFDKIPLCVPFNVVKECNIQYLPAWSLTALLSILDFPALTQEKEDEWEVCVCDYDNDGYIEEIASNPVDACYKMILKLHEQNLL